MKQSVFRNRRGSTLVEFALIMPILLAVLIGIMEFGWLVRVNHMVANASREGARYGALGRTIAETQQRVRESAPSLFPASPAPQVSSIVLEYNNGSSWVAWPADVSSGTKNGVPVDSNLRVTLITAHRSLTGFFPFLQGRAVQQSTVMRREL